MQQFQTFEMRKPRAVDARRAHRQRPEFLETGEISQAHVGHGGIVEVKVLDFIKSGQAVQTCIRNAPAFRVDSNEIGVSGAEANDAEAAQPANCAQGRKTSVSDTRSFN